MHGDPRDPSGVNPSPSAGWQTRALWRKTCALAAKDGGVDKYENAVYGILSGYLPSTLAVCDNWNDCIFAHYNSYLLTHFDKTVKQEYADRIPPAPGQEHGGFSFKTSAGHRPYSAIQLIERMKRTEPTAKQGTSLIKMLQGSIIAKSFDDFVSIWMFAHIFFNFKLIPWHITISNERDKRIKAGFAIIQCIMCIGEFMVSVPLIHSLEVSSGMECVCAQDVVAVNTAEKHCCTVGEISKHVTVTPDIDAILDSVADL